MYVPKHFAEERLEVLRAAIERISLATLVSLGPDGLTATHLPMLLDAAAGPHGTLFGHVARGNPQWRERDDSVETLAIFLGPEAYVSPSWYATKRETGKVVPTWNYLTVHAYGRLEMFEDPDRLRTHVERLTATHDSEWRLSDAPAEFTRMKISVTVSMSRSSANSIKPTWLLTAMSQ